MRVIDYAKTVAMERQEYLTAYFLEMALLSMSLPEVDRRTPHPVRAS